ncbi:DNA polymerase beta superfamily protein [Metabacillus sp. 84]|uniref:DNA polymerase beta superfamily protein n=1 Tax=unclassified Metabacillus TaxID=2675274 RepID=UPI003CF166B2
MPSIPSILADTELSCSVKICYAAETGSRIWGYASELSDYDVRFIYIHSPDWYLSIDQGRDVIELSASGPLDMSGWELTKAMRLFRKSNPSLLEWLYSETVYVNRYSLADRLRMLNDSYFEPKPALFHFLTILNSNKKRLAGNEIPVKAYLNLLRAMASASWVAKRGTFPPSGEQVFTNTHQILKDEFSRAGAEKLSHNLSISLSREVQEFIHLEYENLRERAESFNKKGEDPTPELNLLFRNVLHKAWK